MVKYFCSSDIHSFYSCWKTALDNSGFDVNNSEHKVIICGDLFDRGNEACECLEFVKTLAEQNRLIYIRGNHEDLLAQAVNQLLNSSVSPHHFSNGTIKTIRQFTNSTEHNVLFLNYNPKEFNKTMRSVLDFIDNTAVDYFELGDTVFVHGWVPATITSADDPTMCVAKSWRDGNWTDARWENGMEIHYFGIVPSDKKQVVCGHWHSSYGHANITKVCSEWDDDAVFTPFMHTNSKSDVRIIALDACTAHSGFVNVLVFDDKGNIIEKEEK